MMPTGLDLPGLVVYSEGMETTTTPNTNELLVDAQDDDPSIALAITSALDDLIALARVEHLIPDAVWDDAVDQRATEVAALVTRPDLVDDVADWLVDIATDLAIEDNPR